MAKMQRPARVWRKSHHNAALNPLEGRKIPRAIPGLAELAEELRGELLKKPPPLRPGHHRNLRDHPPCKGTDLANPAPELRMIPEHRTDDRSAFWGTIVFHCVLQSVDEEQMFDISGHTLRNSDL
jgi:hypothetical protein